MVESVFGRDSCAQADAVFPIIEHRSIILDLKVELPGREQRERAMRPRLLSAGSQRDAGGSQRNSKIERVDGFHVRLHRLVAKFAPDLLVGPVVADLGLHPGTGISGRACPVQDFRDGLVRVGQIILQPGS